MSFYNKYKTKVDRRGHRNLKLEPLEKGEWIVNVIGGQIYLYSSKDIKKVKISLEEYRYIKKGWRMGGVWFGLHCSEVWEHHFSSGWTKR
jgi:hypothetical protein